MKEIHASGRARVAGPKQTWSESVPSGPELRDAKRRAVMREAARAFSRNGVQGTSLDMLARQLGVTKAALYHYFPNKSALLRACFDEAIEVAFGSLQDAIDKGKNGREKLQLVFSSHIQNIIDDVVVVAVVMENNALSPTDHKAVVNKRKQFEAALRDLVTEGISDGSIVDCDPKLVVLTMLGAVNWVTVWYRKDGDWSVQQLSRAMTEILERAISAQPAHALTGT